MLIFQLKKKNYDKFINQKNLKNNLIDLKDLFNENYQEQVIMHMLINNYFINNKKYSSLRNNLIGDNLCLEVNFISISNESVLILSKILEKYQIIVSRYMCGKYVKNFFKKDQSEISLKAFKLKDGFNDNEVILIPKNIKNIGFFEKFFQLFS